MLGKTARDTPHGRGNPGLRHIQKIQDLDIFSKFSKNLLTAHKIGCTALIVFYSCCMYVMHMHILSHVVKNCEKAEKLCVQHQEEITTLG
jgi:hypothetical protein